MRKLLNAVVLFSIFTLCTPESVMSAPAPQRGRGVAAPANNAGGGAASGVTSARAARAPIAARSGTTPTAAAGVTSARSGTTPVSAGAPKAAPAVSARAGTLQSVKSTGTKITAANKNVVVDGQCQEKYYGCMDSFCMVENDNGGRCVCSNRKAELDVALTEIEKLNSQIIALRTKGVETIEMGSKADAVMATANAAVKNALTSPPEEEKKPAKRRTLDMSILNAGSMSLDDDDSFEPTSQPNELEGKRGDSVHQAVGGVCVAQMPECQTDIKMLQMMYTQQVRSDCSAYENYLKTQKNESQKTLAVAESEVRTAALNAFESANKYDLGQCTLEYKKCMITTAGCGEDFSGCVGIAASENASLAPGVKDRNGKVAGKAAMKMYSIKGAASQIQIAASSYDAILSKKPLCESVTNSCMLVQDQVFDVFLREVAPQLKTAELIAESNLRTSCISNISNCFQKACKDNIDPNDKEGSYDMCLSRPETMRSLCKVQIDPCEAAEPKVLDFVYAKLASMRVDSCTTEVKECLQSSDRCGEDYSQCIGLDRESISNMCPKEKLVGCQEDINGKVDFNWEKINQIIQGIYLNIDNSMLNTCQAAVDAKMIEICGDSSGGCDAAFESDKNFGSESLAINLDKADELSIIGLIDYSKLADTKSTTVNTGENVTTTTDLKIGDYTGCTPGISFCNQSLKAVDSVRNKVNSVIAMLESDGKIGMCINGRNMSQVNGRTPIGAGENGRTGTNDTARFPNLLDVSKRQIVQAGIQHAKQNYDKKFEATMKQAMEKISAIKSSAGDISGGGMCYDKSIMGDLDFIKNEK